MQPRAHVLNGITDWLIKELLLVVILRDGWMQHTYISVGWIILTNQGKMSLKSWQHFAVKWLALYYIWYLIRTRLRIVIKIKISSQSYVYIFGDSVLQLASQSWHTVYMAFTETLQWRHNGHGSVSNHQPHDWLLNRLFRCRSKKTSKLRVSGLCEGNSPGTGEFPAQMASDAENVSIWWRHHEIWADASDWINNSVHKFLWDIIICPCYHFIEVRAWMKNNHNHCFMWYKYLAMP